VTYRFSFDNVIGTVPGTVEGTVEFDFLTSASDSGTGPASSIEIISAPAAIPASSEGDVVTTWMTQAINTFTIVNGVITDYQFGASEGAVPTASDNVFCLNNGGFFEVGGVYVCGSGENYLGDGSNFVYNVDGIQAVDFRPIADINFTGQLDIILQDNGSAVYSSVPVGTTFFGAINDGTFSGFISDGTTRTDFSCCIDSIGLEVANDEVLNATIGFHRP
jgi:hypothetical protein